MKELLINIDWAALVTAIWTIVCIPIGKQIYDNLKTRKVDKYAKILYEEMVKAVKGVHETEVKDIKNDPELWTGEKQNEVKEIAKEKALQALSNAAYKMLREENADFDNWLESMIGTALYEVKQESK